MTVFIATFVFFIAIIALMSIGVIIANKSIKGSCGGLSSIDGLERACDICEVKDRCKRKRELQST
jgi:hypothetical protein